SRRRLVARRTAPRTALIESVGRIESAGLLESVRRVGSDGTPRRYDTEAAEDGAAGDGWPARPRTCQRFLGVETEKPLTSAGGRVGHAGPLMGGTPVGEAARGRRTRLRSVDLARTVGISTQQVRNYEDWGVLPPVPRSEFGYRHFDERH